MCRRLCDCRERPSSSGDHPPRFMPIAIVSLRPRDAVRQVSPFESPLFHKAEPSEGAGSTLQPSSSPAALDLPLEQASTRTADRVGSLAIKASSLEVDNANLRAQLEAAQSQLPAQHLAYEQLKGSFFRLQTLYAASAAARDRAEREVAELRARLASAETALAARGAADSGRG